MLRDFTGFMVWNKGKYNENSPTHTIFQKIRTLLINICCALIPSKKLREKIRKTLIGVGNGNKFVVVKAGIDL